MSASNRNSDRKDKNIQDVSLHSLPRSIQRDSSRAQSPNRLPSSPYPSPGISLVSRNDEVKSSTGELSTRAATPNALGDKAADQKMTLASTTMTSIDGDSDSSTLSWWKHGRRWCRNGWVAEGCGWVLACGALSAMIGVLHRLDGRPLPDWPRYITVNALVSLFTILLKFGLGLGLSNGKL